MEGTGLVLAGGGGKGIYQVGMIKALAEAGKLDDIAAVSGTSIGCINAILYAEGMAEGDMQHTIDQMEEVWEKIDNSVFFNIDISAIKAGDKHFSRNSAIRMIDEYINYSFFDDSNDIQIMPMFAAVAKCPPEIDTKEEITAEELKFFSMGSDDVYSRYELEYLDFRGKDKEYVRNGVLASSALPVIYSPVQIENGLYIDGGVKDNIPVKPLYDMGIRRFIVIELSSKSYLDTSLFPDAEFIDIVPSRSLGGLLSGTMCFDKEDLAVKKELGYRDGKRYIKTLFDKDEAYIAIEKALAESDYQDILYQRKFNKTYDKLSSDIEGRFDYIKNIEDKYKF